MLKVENLSVSYGDKIILKDINFCVSNYEKLSIVGLNGSGKTTLLKAICNIIDYEGCVYINDVNIKKMKRKELSKKISIFSQNYSSYFDYKVIDVVKLGRYSHESRGIFFLNNKDENKVLESISKLNIDHLKFRYLSELSGGERQKVFLARVFAQDPDIILLDEPTNNLDLKAQVNLIQNIESLFRQKIVISVIHDLNTINNLNSNILMLKDRNIYRYGMIDEVFSRENLKKVYDMDVKEYMTNSLLKWQKRK